MAVPITALYGAILGVFNVALAANVSRVRGKVQIFLGTGDSEELALAVRRHANNAEYVPLALVLLLTAELAGGASGVLHGVGGALVLGRLLHAVGIGVKPSAPRVLGVLFTWLSIAAAGIYAALVAMR
jgi:uncharacterized membrane protein YecN with MAPEG domain